MSWESPSLKGGEDVKTSAMDALGRDERCLYHYLTHLGTKVIVRPY